MIEPSNLYTSPAYMEVIRRSYCDDRLCMPADFIVEGRRFRLLATLGWKTGFRLRPAPMPPFLDMHEPIASEGGYQGLATLSYLPKVAHGMVESEKFSQQGLQTSYMAAPTVWWERFATWDDYLKFLRERSSMIKDDQRRMRRLAETMGPVTFAVDDSGDDVVSKVLAWKSAQMLETLGVDLFADLRNRRFFEEMRKAGLLKISTLRADGRLIASWWGAIYQGRWYGWIFAHDPDEALRKLSVGRLLLYRMLEESHRLGHREFDFSIGDEPYKWFFSTHARLIAPLGTVPLHLKLRKTAVEAIKSQPWLEKQMRTGLGLARSAAKFANDGWLTKR
jgi:hypothetical protein